MYDDGIIIDFKVLIMEYIELIEGDVVKEQNGCKELKISVRLTPETEEKVFTMEDELRKKAKKLNLGLKEVSNIVREMCQKKETENF